MISGPIIAALIARLILLLFPFTDSDDYNPPPVVTEAFQDPMPSGG